MNDLLTDENQPLREPLRIQCFGSFEIFYDNVPIHFQYSKTKELAAYLVDQRGAILSMGQILATLFDGDASKSAKSYLRNLIADLRRTLSEKDLGDLVDKRWNAIGLRCAGLDCDYFRFLDGDPAAAAAYRGSYMEQYDWAEMRIPELDGML